jgi:hypothetical protein
MHADIGGGYPDDSLSLNALAWMMGEAHAAGLEFLPHAHERFAPPPGRSAMLHDSRKGLAGYYRYQPRRLSAYLLPNDLETEVMRDPTPTPKARAHVSRIKLHHTAVDRIRNSTDRYAPIVMPAEFDVVDPAGAVAPSGETAAARTARMVGQKGVWDIVWHKRVNYFLVVACSIIFALMPLWGAPAASAACESWVCVISPVIRTVGAFLPAFLQYWIDAMESHPGYTMTFVAVLTGLLLRSAVLQRQIQDHMWRLWAPERGGAIPFVSVPTSWVHRMRTSKRYLDAIRWIKCDQEPAMNAFYEHHRDSIRFGDRWHYLANWRIQVATQKLRSTSASLAQVAEIVGYASEAAFSRIQEGVRRGASHVATFEQLGHVRPNLRPLIRDTSSDGA